MMGSNYLTTTKILFLQDTGIKLQTIKAIQVEL